MSEATENLSIAASGSGKSPEEVAFELVSKLKGQGVWGERNMGAILDMYAECLIAAKGQRIVEGLRAAEQPLTTLRPQTQPAPANAAPAQTTLAQSAPVQTPPQPTEQQTASPVHAQQQAVQQAFKQG